MSEKQQAILEALEGKALTSVEVAEAVSEDTKRTSAMLTYMKTHGRVQLQDGRWSLAVSTPPAPAEETPTPPPGQRKGHAARFQPRQARQPSSTSRHQGNRQRGAQCCHCRRRQGVLSGQGSRLQLAVG